MHLRRIFLSLLVALPLAADVDPSLFRDLHWRLVGPFRGGRVLAVTGISSEPEHFYFGSVNGGVWETHDAGRTWDPIFDSQPIGSIGALAVAPSNAKVLYVGSGEADMRSDISQGDGMYKSVDGGRSWSKSGLADSQQIARILIHPENPDLVYVAALGHPYAANTERGVFRSADGGRTWKKILGREASGSKGTPRGKWDSDTGAVDLAFEPGNANVIYASLWQTRRPPWSVYPPSNGPGSGLFKSTDGGDSWTELRGHGLPANPGRIGIAVAPSVPQRVYAVIDADQGGMYRSDDGGANWSRTSSDTRIWGRGWYFSGVTVEPKNPEVVYSCNVNLFQSMDGGKSWVPVKGAPGGDDYHSLWIDPQRPERRILGVDQGALVSLNGGKTWSSWYNQPTGQFYHVSTDNSFPYRIYGSQQDSGAAGVPSRTNTIDGIGLSEFREITAGGESDNVAPDPNDPDILYGGRVEKLDLRTHQTRLIDPTMAYPSIDRRTWTLPLVFSVRDPHVLYFSNQRLFRTEDGGEHWTVISGDLTREDPGTPANLDAATAALKPDQGPRHGVVYSIAPSPIADHDLWVGTDDGLVWRTTDEGAHWTNVTPFGLLAWSKVAGIEASHFDTNVAYAAVDRHRLDDFKPYIYRTRDGGKTWQLISTGIPNGSVVNAVREDPVRRGLLYAATEKGVVISFDDGERWQSLQSNLPVTSVRDLVVHGNDLVIATHGRAFWVMDDVSPLRQVAAAVSGAGGAYLFAPSDAVRMRPAGFTGTPMPLDEAMASNPPAGAYLDYYLAGPAKAVVRLEILDERDAVIRRYSSEDVVPRPNPERLRTAAEWFVTPSSLSTGAGMHRFVWPMRYASSPELAGRSGSWADGAWAPPGHYKVVLSVDGVRLEQPLTITADPRLHLPPAAYAAQFELAREIAAAWGPLHVAHEEADTVVAKLGARRSLVSPQVARSIDAVLTRMASLFDMHYATNPGNGWWIAAQRTGSLRFLESQYDKLMNAVDGADAAPSPDARAAFATLRPAGETASREWAAFKAADLLALNATLKKAGQDAIVP